MTNDDKQFFKTLISDMDQKWDKRLNNFEQKWDTKFINLADEVRYNGVLIEELQSKVEFVAGQVTDFNTKLSEVRSDIAEIKESISDYPIVKRMAQKHDKQLAKMR